jgi:hypothetical protein
MKYIPLFIPTFFYPYYTKYIALFIQTFVPLFIPNFYPYLFQPYTHIVPSTYPYYTNLLSPIRPSVYPLFLPTLYPYYTQVHTPIYTSLLKPYSTKFVETWLFCRTESKSYQILNSIKILCSSRSFQQHQRPHFNSFEIFSHDFNLIFSEQIIQELNPKP